MTKVTNYTGHPFRGWFPGTTGVSSPYASGVADGVPYVVGRALGHGLGHQVDFLVDLGPNESIPCDLATSIPTQIPMPTLPEEGLKAPGRYYGIPHVYGVPLDFLSMEHDGAALAVSFRGRVLPMLLAELHVRHYPEQGWSPCELVLTCSNPSIEDVRETLPGDLVVEFKRGQDFPSGAVVFTGRPGLPALQGGDWFGDGQARAFHGVVIWPDRMKDYEVEAAGCYTEIPPQFDGVWPETFTMLGTTPIVQGHIRAADWFRQHVGETLDTLHSWRASRIGPTAHSGQTGAQEDQGWVKGSELFAVDGGNAILWTRYLAALTQFKRPLHHREADGSWLDVAAHPSLVFWSGRTHWHHGVSPDRLGKPDVPIPSNGSWSGPDRQHWFLNTVRAGYLGTGSRALQTHLEAHAQSFLFGETVRPGWSTSNAGTDRGIGWTALIAVQLWQLLEDRDLASRVRSRFLQRAEIIVSQAMPDPSWIVGRWSALQDPRVLESLSTPWGWMAYQLGVGAFGAHVAGELFEHQGLKDLALRGALAVVEHAYTEDEFGAITALTEWEIVGEEVAGQPLPRARYVEGDGSHRTGWFRHSWLPLASWVCLQTNPSHERARFVYDTLRAEMERGPKPLEWLPPLSPG